MLALSGGNGLIECAENEDPDILSDFLFGLLDPKLSSLYQHSKSHVTTIILG